MSLPEYELVRSGRKTLAVEITGDCRVVVRAPARLSRERIERFVAEHEAWIEKHLEVQRRRKENHPLPTEAEREAYIKKARDILPGKVERFGRIMGVSPIGITITGAEKRFGSCLWRIRRRPSIMWWCMSWRTSGTRTTVRGFMPLWRRFCRIGGREEGC